MVWKRFLSCLVFSLFLWPLPALADDLTICSFNIQFLGNSTRRDDVALASILADYDIVVVQELVSPPFPGTFPTGNPFNPDAEAAEFFDAMTALGFEFELSIGDTGTGDTIERNGSSTEWFVVFYKPDRVALAADLPTGFIADDRSNHPRYERVPHSFAFRTPDGNLDFVLISVHLKPGRGSSDKARRKVELAAIKEWIHTQDDVEKDFIILGDMNIEDAAELTAATPEGFLSLNDEVVATNTNVNGPKPYDHVMYQPIHSTEIDTTFDFQVVDLIEAMRPHWTSSDSYPGGTGGSGYDHNRFRAFYSDHHPVVFRMNIPDADDDGDTGTGSAAVGGREQMRALIARIEQDLAELKALVEQMDERSGRSGSALQM